MKICYLSNSEIPSPHANSVHVMKMCAALAQQGAKVVLVAKEGERIQNSPFAYYGVKEGAFALKRIRTPKIKLLGQLYFSIRSFVFILRWRAEMVYARSLSSLFLVSFFCRAFMYEAHWPPKSNLLRKIEAYLLKRSNCVSFVVISAALKQIYLRLFPQTDPEKILVAHDAADIPESNAENFSDQVREVGYLGSLYSGRGIEILLGLAKKHPHLKFVAVGGLPEAVAEWREKARKVPNLEFLGHIPHSEIAKQMKDWQIVLAPYQKNLGSLAWASPMKIFEYMAFRKPIICSRFPVFEEVLTDKKNALLVKADDVEDWSRAIDYLKDAKLREQLAKHAYDDFISYYQWNTRAQILIKQMNPNKN